MAKPHETAPRELTTSEAQQYREYIERWKRLGPALDGIRFRELRAMTDDDHVRALTSIQGLGFRRASSDKSGWIAWQKVRERWTRRS